MARPDAAGMTDEASLRAALNNEPQLAHDCLAWRMGAFLGAFVNLEVVRAGKSEQAGARSKSETEGK